jgi:hypothetical protein
VDLIVADIVLADEPAPIVARTRWRISRGLCMDGSLIVGGFPLLFDSLHAVGILVWIVGGGGVAFYRIAKLREELRQLKARRDA